MKRKQTRKGKVKFIFCLDPDADENLNKQLKAISEALKKADAVFIRENERLTFGPSGDLKKIERSGETNEIFLIKRYE